MQVAASLGGKDAQRSAAGATGLKRQAQRQRMWSAEAERLESVPPVDPWNASHAQHIPQIPRVHAAHLSAKEFWDEYASKRRPVVITGLVPTRPQRSLGATNGTARMRDDDAFPPLDQRRTATGKRVVPMSTEVWDVAFLRRTCGQATVEAAAADANVRTWGGVMSMGAVRLDDVLARVDRGESFEAWVALEGDVAAERGQSKCRAPASVFDQALLVRLLLVHACKRC